jgi:rubrerythrin
MGSAAAVLRAAILSAAVSGCCTPRQMGSEVVPVHKARLDLLRAKYVADAGSRPEKGTKEDEDLAVCRMVCTETRQGGESVRGCQIHPIRRSRRAGEPDEGGGPGHGRARPRDRSRGSSEEGPRRTAAVAVDPQDGDPTHDQRSSSQTGEDGQYTEAAPPPPQPEPEYAAVCEMWHYPICGRRPGDWQAPGQEQGASEAAEYLALSARLEADSVQAFEDLAADLARLSAPTRLVRRARRAAEDERRHARAVGRAARRRGARVPSRQRGETRPPLDLEAFATLNAVEGCTLETFGAALARRSAITAATGQLRRMFDRIAGEEASHAELSWAVHRWALRRLAPAARERVEARRRSALERLVAEPPLAPPGARAPLGLPDAASARRMAACLAAGLAGIHPG